MKRGYLSLLVLFLVAILFSTIRWAAAQGQPQQVIQLSLANHIAATSWLNADVYVPMAKEIEKESGGRIKVTIYPAAALSKAEDEYDSTVKDIMDMSMFLPLYTPGVFPLSDVIQLPFAVPNATIGTAVFTKLLDENMLDPGLKDKVVSWLGTTSAAGIFLARKKVTKMEDLKGLKLRTGGGLQNEMGRMLGWTSVTVPGAEFTTAMQSGVVEGGILPIGTGPAYNLMDTTKYVLVANLSVAAIGLAMNKQKYDSLPPDLQKVIDNAARHFLAAQAKGYDAHDKAALDVFKKAGAEIDVLDPAERARWAAASAPIYDDYIKRMKAKGLPIDKTYAEFKRILKDDYNIALPR